MTPKTKSTVRGIALVPAPLLMAQVFQTKYCERCGRLSLRAEGSPEKYCRGCTEAMASLPEPQHSVVGAKGAQSRRRFD